MMVIKPRVIFLIIELGHALIIRLWRSNMADELVNDELWEIVRPLLPPPPSRKAAAGRKRLDERCVFAGILFVLQSGISWERLPKEMGCGSGMTCWRRARDWQKAGVWERLHRILLVKLHSADRLDFSRVITDDSSVRTAGSSRKSRSGAIQKSINIRFQIHDDVA
jgi:transposase